MGFYKDFGEYSNMYETLKEGDEIAIGRFYYDKPVFKFTKVKRRTPAGTIYTEDGHRINKHGTIYGSYDSVWEPDFVRKKMAAYYLACEKKSKLDRLKELLTEKEPKMSMFLIDSLLATLESV